MWYWICHNSLITSIMLLHYLVKCTQHNVHVKSLTFCAKNHQTLFYRTCGIQTAQISVTVDRRVHKTQIRSVDEQRVIDVWCGIEQSTIDRAIDHCHRRLRARMHPFERRTIRTQRYCQYLSHSMQLLFDCYRVTSFIQKCAWQLGIHTCLFNRVVQRQN